MTDKKWPANSGSIASRETDKGIMVRDADNELMRPLDAPVVDDSGLLPCPFEVRVKIRRGENWKVKPKCEDMDGQIITIVYVSEFSDSETSIYRGEYRYEISEEDAKKWDLWWISSGDVEIINRAQPQVAGGDYQSRVNDWMQACFGEAITQDIVERNHRFLEESLELVQSKGCTISEAHQLVDYVFNRPIGEPKQESGGVSVTHAALCIAAGIDMRDAAETELARVWTCVEKIRAKQAAKPKHSPLPEHHQPEAAKVALDDIRMALDIGGFHATAMGNITDALFIGSVIGKLSEPSAALQTPASDGGLDDNELLFGKDCPKGKVQLEFVSVNGGERKGKYQYTPSDSAFLEIYVDGERFTLNVGDLTSHGSEGKRGIHVCGPINLKADRTAINAVNLYGEDIAALKQSTAKDGEDGQ